MMSRKTRKKHFKKKRQSKNEKRKSIISFRSYQFFSQIIKNSISSNLKKNGVYKLEFGNNSNRDGRVSSSIAPATTLSAADDLKRAHQRNYFQSI